MKKKFDENEPASTPLPKGVPGASEQKAQPQRPEAKPVGSAVKAETPDDLGRLLHPAMLEIKTIKLDPELRCRAKINEGRAKEYAQRMRAGEQFPALVVFKVGQDYLLADGFHRYMAALKRQEQKVRVDVREGSRAEALLYGIRANVERGLPLTNQDKRHAAKAVLREFPRWSDHRIAELLKVSAPFIGKVRGSELETVSGSSKGEKRVGRDGKARRLPAKTKRQECSEASSEPANPENTVSELAAPAVAPAAPDDTTSNNKTAPEPQAKKATPLPESVVLPTAASTFEDRLGALEASVYKLAEEFPDKVPIITRRVHQMVIQLEHPQGFGTEEAA